MVPFAAHFASNVSTDFYVRERNRFEYDLVGLNIESNGICYVNVGACAAAVLLPYVPRGVRVLVVPFHIAIEVECFVRRVNGAVRKVDTLRVESERHLQ